MVGELSLQYVSMRTIHSAVFEMQRVQLIFQKSYLLKSCTHSLLLDKSEILL